MSVAHRSGQRLRGCDEPLRNASHTSPERQRRDMPLNHLAPGDISLLSNRTAHTMLV